MRSVMFNFRSDVSPEQQDAILAQIRAWDAIASVGRLKADAKRADILRMSYAYVKDDADIDAVTHRLSEIPEMDNASMPAERHLL